VIQRAKAQVASILQDGWCLYEERKWMAGIGTVVPCKYTGY
jgi:hypothetical protein